MATSYYVSLHPLAQWLQKLRHNFHTARWLQAEEQDRSKVNESLREAWQRKGKVAQAPMVLT